MKLSKPSIDLSKLYKPHSRQVLFHQSPHKGRLFGGAIRGGKTKAGVAEGIQLSIDYPGNVGIMARQNLPAFKRTVMVELERYFDAGVHTSEGYKRLITQHHATDHYIQFWNGSRIWYVGLGDDTRGLASQMGTTLGWFFIDQVEECSEMHFNNLLGRLSLNLKDIKLKYFLTANPMPGWVKMRFIESHPDDFIYIPSLPRDNPYLPEGYEDELRKMYPEELVKAWLDGDWDVMEHGNFVFSYSEITKAIDRDVNTEGARYMGVDLSWGGADESIAIVRQGGKVLTIERWKYRKEDSILSADKVIELMHGYNVEAENVAIDAISGGSPIYSEIIGKGYAIKPIGAGEEADDKKLYVNKRAEMYYQLEKWFKDGVISIPNDRDLVAQLSSIRYEIASEKRLQLVSKEYMRKHGEKSPDRADALALAFYEAKKYNPDIRWL